MHYARTGSRDLRRFPRDCTIKFAYQAAEANHPYGQSKLAAEKRYLRIVKRPVFDESSKDLKDGQYPGKRRRDRTNVGQGSVARQISAGLMT